MPDAHRGKERGSYILHAMRFLGILKSTMTCFVRGTVHTTCIMLILLFGVREGGATSDNEVHCIGDFCELVTPNWRGHFDVDVSKEPRNTVIAFPDKLTFLDGPESKDFRVISVDNNLVIEVLEKAEKDAVLAFTAYSQKAILTFGVRLGSPQMGRSYRVTNVSEIKKLERAVIDSQEKRNAGSEYERRARMGLHGVYVVPKQSGVKDVAPVHAQVESGLWGEGELMIIMKLQNDSSLPYRLRELLVRGRTKPIEPRHIHVEPHRAELDESHVMAMLPPGAHASIVMFLPDEGDGELTELYVEANAAAFQGVIVAAVDDWERPGPIWLKPKTKEEIAEEQREREERRLEYERLRQDREARGRRSVYLGGIFGSVSLDNAAGDNEFTTMMGVDLRTMYGFTRYLSVQGSVAFLRTDEAQFDDGSTADATSGRVLLGGVLRGGTGTLVPYAHAGIGARLSSHGRTAEDSEVRSSLLVNVGGGVDTQLSNDFAVGLSAQYVSGIGSGSDDSVGFEAGIYAGYVWGIASSPLSQAAAERPKAVTELQSD